MVEIQAHSALPWGIKRVEKVAANRDINKRWNNLPYKASQSLRLWQQYYHALCMHNKMQVGSIEW